jgi:hypothetical protein
MRLLIPLMSFFCHNCYATSDVLLLMQIMIKCADVSHATRILPLHKKWTARIKEEFHNQGDLERKSQMPISPLCDRHSCFLPREQQGFIDYVVIPVFRPFSLFVGSKTYLKNCAENYKYCEYKETPSTPLTFMLLMTSIQPTTHAI